MVNAVQLSQMADLMGRLNVTAVEARVEWQKVVGYQHRVESETYWLIVARISRSLFLQSLATPPIVTNA
jgi:hypothetical protein